MSNTIPQQVMWAVQLNDGKIIQEFDSKGEETVFSDELLEKKQTFKYIALVDRINNLHYSIDLENGKVILGSQEFDVCKEMDGRVYSICNKKIDYRDGVIQYKVSKPILVKAKKGKDGIMLEQQKEQAKPKTFTIGYKVSLDDNFITTKRGDCEIAFKKCQVLVTVDADTMTPGIAITFLAEMKYPDGSVEMIRL